MKKVLCLVLFAVSAVAYPTCGNGQIDVASLTNCSVGYVNFSNWSFDAPGYNGHATVQIAGAADYAVDPELITLRISDPLFAQAGFTFSFVATLTNGYEFDRVVQELSGGADRHGASAAGEYSSLILTTGGSSALSAQGELPLSEDVHVQVIGEIFQPPNCNKGKCDGGPVEKVDIQLFQTVPIPEPMSLGLVGMGLFAIAVVRKRRA